MNKSTVIELEKILKALANKRRLKILKYLQSIETASVSKIAEEIDASLKATSKHLRLLKIVGTIECEQKRFENYYRLVNPPHLLVKNSLTLLEK